MKLWYRFLDWWDQYEGDYHVSWNGKCSYRGSANKVYKGWKPVATFLAFYATLINSAVWHHALTHPEPVKQEQVLVLPKRNLTRTLQEASVSNLDPLNLPMLE